MVKSHPLNGAHTAGILADMSIDGPDIGTLVIIVDRAKNLPNRKTIGKQDPYCAARLGKIAKKTTTDIRGGQTPKWDQELRFTVHDSPDYYQLKISVFNDDKKTELIGEAWIDLRDIVIPGGGQNDLWQSLSCRGKYAGEIRIEITYYDTRPKPEKPVAKPKPVAADIDSAAASLRALPKRRPLPSDPYTGQAPAQPPRPTSRDFVSNHPQPPEHHTPPRVPQQMQSMQSMQSMQPVPPAPYSSNHTPSHSGQYSDSSLRHRQPETYSSGPSNAYHTLPKMIDGPRVSTDRHPVYAEDTMYSPDHYGQSPDMRYPSSVPYSTSPNDQAFGAELDDDRPPPPPAHRNSPGGPPEVNYSPNREMTLHNQTPPAMRKEVLRNEAHRQSVSTNSYPGRPVYRAYDSAPSASQSGNDSYANGNHQQLVAQSRHRSYDTAYDSHHKSLQATVEDVPDSPSSALDEARRSAPRTPESNEQQRHQDRSPAPLSLRSRGSAPVSQYRTSPVPSSQRHSMDFSRSDQSLSTRDYRPSSASQATYDAQSHNGYTPYRSGSEHELDDTQVRAPDGSMRYALPSSVPAALVPGVDPNISMEITQRVNEDRRHERRHTQPPSGNQSMTLAASSTRGRKMIEPPPSYGAPPPEPSHQYSTSQPRRDSHDAFERRPAPYSGVPSSQQTIKRREVSPNPMAGGQHTIRRKSVSPAPPPDGRRLSGVPFGPDSYDALNPVLSASAPNDSPRPDYDENNGKIIMYDGKEVDPSDHLPMDTWAPEPEPKPKKPETSPTRPALSGPQPIPPSGRRPLRVRETRPTSMISLPPAPYGASDPSSRHALPPPGTVRNRLQKKTNRSSAMPVVINAGPGPLAPLAQPQDNYTPRPLGRSSTYDYENYAPPPMYDTSPSFQSRDHSISAPPVPAKVPLTAGSGAMVPMNRNGYGDFGGQQALMEEMSRIDIGTGRARRHQRYY
ncbi:Ingression protein fic1 [Cytospora mali]|uniref:Ingression protein fic1 n=1 Tax=Cytospora mali TaxID=578113 RepID=A0A194VAY8_CYTMA|nr:Ingression protein fic1 [Valsa mali var. pyri (nom. inval.)]